METFYKTNWLLKVRTLAMVVAFFITGGMTYGQFSGSYTIDATGITGGTNFASFTDFADSITTYGVSGSVTVDVVASTGPYNENLVLSSISGVSSTNTVTINGNGNTITANDWVIELDGADYVHISDLVVDATGTGNGVGCLWIHNSSNYNTVSDCELIVSAHTGTNSATGYVLFSASSLSFSATGNHGTGNTFEGNVMSNGGNTGAGPYFGVCDYRAAANSDANLSLIDNEISDVYYYFTLLYHSRFATVTGNDIHTTRGSGTVYALYNYYGRRIDYSNNVVHDLEGSTLYSAYMYYCNGTSSARSNFSNNEFYNFDGNTNYGAYMYYSDYVDYMYNESHDCEATGYNYYLGGYIYYCSYSSVNYNKIHDNEANAYNYYVFYVYYSDNTEFVENEVYNQLATQYNYYAYYLAYCDDVVLRGNSYHDNIAGYYNLYIFQLQYCQSLTVEDNMIYDNSATYGQQMYFYIYQCPNSVIQRNMATGNSSGQYEYYFMYVYYCDNSEVINNVYYGNSSTYGFNYILFSGYNNNIVVAHNTVVLDQDVQYTNNYVWYFNYYNTPQNVKFHNNVLYIDGSTGYGYQYPIYCYYNADQIDFANNVLHIKSPGTLNFYANAAIYSSYALWKEAANDETSVDVDPMFVNMASGDLTPTNPEIANMGTPGLAALDYNLDTRTACGPDPGAFEFFVDHSASNLVFNGTNECGNYMEEISIDFNNGSSADMEDVEMFYTINGKNKVTEYIDFVGANSSETHTFATIPTFNTPGNNTVTVGLGCDDDESNNTIDHDIFITPSPYGADLTQGSTWNGYWNTGNYSDPDVTVPGELVIYDLQAPAAYNYGGYGSDWTWTSNIQTESGDPLDDADGFVIVPPAGSVPLTIEVDPDASLQGQKVYVSFIIEDINTGCDSTIGRWMYIPQTPKPDFAFNPVCLGEVTQFSNLSTMPGPNVMAFKWRFGDPNATDDSAESKIGVWQYTTYGTFDVTLEVLNFAYPKFVYTQTKTVSVTPTPDVAFQVVNACEGTDIEFINGTTLPLPGTISYEWNFGDGSAISTQTNPSHLYASSKAEGYLVTLKAEANGCVSELTKKAYQFATPVADFSTNGACNLEDISFINETSIAIGKSGYNWDFGDGGISTAKDPKHAFSTPGTKSVTLSAFSEFGCEDQITLDVELLESPEADFEIDQACNLTPVNFTRTGSIPGTANDNDFQWNFNGQSGSSLENPSFLFSDVGEKEITLTISSLNGCTSTVTKEINVVLQAVADFSVEDICEGVPAVFINKSSVSAGDLTYKWYLGNGDSSDHVNPSYDYEVLGNTRVVNITLRAVVEGGCNAEISKPLTINAAPDATFGSVKDGRFVQLDGPSGMTAYAWRFGDGSKSTDEDPIYEYQNVDQGSFVICLSVMNDMCWSEYCETVSVDLVGVEDLSRDAEIEVYPNPSTGVFTVEVSEASDDVLITVVDVLGNEIPLTVVDNMDGSYVIDMSNVAAGVYIVQVKNGDSYATKRITVTR